MGEAKRKLEDVRKGFLANLEDWAFEPSEWEARSVAEIQALPIVKVQRYTDDALAYMRMPARQCHSNVEFMVKNDPTGQMKHVTGWWLQHGNYVLHSVDLHEGKYLCVTPAPLEQENNFDFVPDGKIEWREEGDVRVAYREEVAIGKGIRGNPAESLAEIETIKRRLLSGMNPYEAVKR